MLNKYLFDKILRPHSSSSHHPLRSSNRLDVLVPLTRAVMVAQYRSFASIGPCPWNVLCLSARSSLLSGNFSSSFALLKTCFFSWGLFACFLQVQPSSLNSILYCAVMT